VLLHSKGNNYQNQETTYRLGEDLYQLFSAHGIISRMYKELKKLNTKRITQLINGK
jgi:hypothetical protein